MILRFHILAKTIRPAGKTSFGNYTLAAALKKIQTFFFQTSVLSEESQTVYDSFKALCGLLFLCRGLPLGLIILLFISSRNGAVS